MNYLLLIRHGESRWNTINKFTGWVDVPLSEGGVDEAIVLAKKFKDFRFDIGFTSKLERAQQTLLIILSYHGKTGIVMHENERSPKWKFDIDLLGKNEIPIFQSIALNERHYGLLQGLDKNHARKKYGEQKVYLWRRSYDEAPPQGESLRDTYRRVIPYFSKTILPLVKKGKNVVVCAHGNTLRSIVKYIDGISSDEIANLELATGETIMYTYKKGKLSTEKERFTFDRPIFWESKS